MELECVIRSFQRQTVAGKRVASAFVERSRSQRVNRFGVQVLGPKTRLTHSLSRLFCDSESFKVSLILDVNTQLYPVKLDDKFRIMLSSTLRDDGYPEEDEYDPCFSCQRLENFEYIMYGKVYRIETDESAGSDSCRVSVYASFGGLLLRLQGDANYMHGFEIDSNIYLLMKHVGAYLAPNRCWNANVETRNNGGGRGAQRRWSSSPAFHRRPVNERAASWAAKRACLTFPLGIPPSALDGWIRSLLARSTSVVA